MKKTSILVLILVLLLVPMLSLYSCDESKYHKTAIGKIEYIQTFEYHCIYVRPLDQGENGIWIPINITEETEILCGLAVGNIVEIVYSTKKPYNVEKLNGYQAISLKGYDTANNTTPKQKIPFEKSKGYEYSTETKSIQCVGTVVHVAKMDSPISGYLLYLDDFRFATKNDLAVYFLDSSAIDKAGSMMFLDDEIKAKIESFETGYDITVFALQDYPFKDFSVRSVLNIAMYNSN